MSREQPYTSCNFSQAENALDQIPRVLAGLRHTTLYGVTLDHAAYFASWLRGDKRAIFTAAVKAHAAMDWMHARPPAAAVGTGEVTQARAAQAGLERAALTAFG